jgi:acetyl esterase
MQILLVPPTIHTAGRHGYRQRTPWAPGAARIEWYDSLLYPNGAGTESPEASPLLASLDQLKGVTNAWIGIAEEDALREEGFAFAEKLQEAGVKVSWIEYQKVPHMLLQLDKQLEIPVIEDIVGVVKSCIDA